MTLDANFPPYSPGSRRLYDVEDKGEQHLLSAELRRTHAALVASLPGRVAKGQLTDDEASGMAGLWRAIGDDLEAQDAWLAERTRGVAGGAALAARLIQLRERNGVAWEDKVATLRREIEARRLGYPAEIDKGRLTRDQAREQLGRLEAVHDLYWRQGYAFDGTRDELRELSDRILDADVAQQGLAA